MEWIVNQNWNYFIKAEWGKLFRIGWRRVYLQTRQQPAWRHKWNLFSDYNCKKFKPGNEKEWARNHQTFIQIQNTWTRAKVLSSSVAALLIIANDTVSVKTSPGHKSSNFARVTLEQKIQFSQSKNANFSLCLFLPFNKIKLITLCVGVKTFFILILPSIFLRTLLHFMCVWEERRSRSSFNFKNQFWFFPPTWISESIFIITPIVWRSHYGS